VNKNRRQIVIGNWKLHGSIGSVTDLLQQLVSGWVGVHQAEVVVCPAHVHLLHAYNELAQSNIALGGQDVSAFDSGPYTGDVSAEMLHDAGCQYAVVGHSERRRFHCETNEQVARKVERAQAAMLVPIVCVGESFAERQAGIALEVIERQLAAVIDHCGVERLARAVVAYEPLWAVGTGVTAEPEQAQEVHAHIRAMLGSVGLLTRIVYGGSVKSTNAKALFAQPDIDGALVGGASLIAQEFLDICQAAE
jgi:triosephosphate isomerase (TIM)